MWISSLLSIVCLFSLVNAAFAVEESMSVPQFVDYMMKHGDDATVPVGKDGPLLGLPPADNHTLPIKGDSTDKGELGPDRDSSCEIILDGKKGRPVCMLVVVDHANPKARQNLGFEYKFDLRGRLLSAVSVIGELTEAGEPVEGTAQNTVLNTKDRSIASQARAELQYWLKRTARAMAKKKKAQTSTGSGAETGALAAEAR